MNHVFYRQAAKSAKVLDPKTKVLLFLCAFAALREKILKKDPIKAIYVKFLDIINGLLVSPCSNSKGSRKLYKAGK
jgi:hypothetical protein